MDYRLLNRAKNEYWRFPCHCVVCGVPLPLYHHRDHTCESCLADEIDKIFDPSLSSMKEVLDVEEDNFSDEIPF